MSKKKLEQMLTATFALNYDLRYFVEDGITWWVAVDVAKILDIEKVRNTLANFPDNEKKIFDILNTAHTVGGGGVLKPTWCVNEPGLYRLIFQSRKPEAEKFKSWVFHEVLPSIRKNGYYAVERPEQLEHSDKPKEKLLEDWKPTGTFEDVATVTNILDQKGIDYDYDLTSVTFEYNEELGMICPTYNFKLKLND